MCAPVESLKKIDSLQIYPQFIPQVYSTETQHFKTIEGRTAARIGMRLQLQSIHFGGAPTLTGGGQLVLRCTAQIGNIYQESTEKELGIPQKDPIPARGELSNLLIMTSFVAWIKIEFEK